MVPGTRVPVQTHLSPILRIQADTEWILVKRRGRFAMDVDCARSPAHREAAIDKAFHEMVEGLKHRPEGSYEYVSSGPEFSGRKVGPPLEHFEFSPDVSPDPGTVPPPHGDRDAHARWERAEATRRARGLDTHDLVDFVLTAYFRKSVKPGFRVHVPYQSEVRAILNAQGAVQRLAQSMASGRSGLVTARR